MLSAFLLNHIFNVTYIILYYMQIVKICKIQSALLLKRHFWQLIFGAESWS